MPQGLLAAYVEMLPPLHAERQLAAWDVERLPYVKSGPRDSELSAWRREASKVQPRRVRKATPDDMAAIGIADEEVSRG